METPQQICEWLLEMSHARAVVLIGEDHDVIARAGERGLLDDKTGAPLLDENFLRLLLANKETWRRLRRDENTHIHVSLVRQKLLLAVVFDGTTSLGLVRLRSKKAAQELSRARW
jgi:hypothetical protein